MEYLIGILIGALPTFIYYKNKVYHLQERLIDKDAIISVLKKHISAPNKKGPKGR